MNPKIIIIIIAIIAALFSLTAGCGGNGTLKVFVTDTDGSPVIGAKVVSESQPAGQLKIEGITSEEAPVVVLNNIKPGEYQIQVSCYGYAPETLEFTVPAGKTKSVVVKLFFASPPPIT